MRWIIVGAVARYTIKKVMKIAAVVIGLFVVGVSYLPYKGWIGTNWMDRNGECNKGIFTNVAGQIEHTLDNAVSQTAVYPSRLEALRLLLAVTFGLMLGLMFGLPK